jgi:hypothetical protein
MGKIVLGVMLGLMSLGIIGVLIVAFAVHSVASNGASSPAVSQIDESRAIHVSAVKLWSDYHANEVAADNVYKGQQLIVTGMVKGISKDAFDEAYLQLATFNEFENVDAYLRPSELTAASRIRVYQPVTVVCTGAGMVIVLPELRDCIIQAEQSPVQKEQSPQVSNPGIEAPANTSNDTQQSQPVSSPTRADNTGAVRQDSPTIQSLPQPTQASKIAIGQTEQQVIGILGDPPSVTTGANRILNYPEFRLVFRDGLLVQIRRD